MDSVQPDLPIRPARIATALGLFLTAVVLGCSSLRTTSYILNGWLLTLPLFIAPWVILKELTRPYGSYLPRALRWPMRLATFIAAFSTMVGSSFWHFSDEAFVRRATLPRNRSAIVLYEMWGDFGDPSVAVVRQEFPLLPGIIRVADLGLIGCSEAQLTSSDESLRLTCGTLSIPINPSPAP